MYINLSAIVLTLYLFIFRFRQEWPSLVEELKTNGSINDETAKANYGYPYNKVTGCLSVYLSEGSR